MVDLAQTNKEQQGKGDRAIVVRRRKCNAIISQGEQLTAENCITTVNKGEEFVVMLLSSV
jgi:hypothetical protein